MSQRTGVEDLASLPPRTLQAALKVSEEREANRRRIKQSNKRKIVEKRELEAKLKRVKEELRDESTHDDESTEDEIEERPAKRMRKSTPKVPVASTSTKEHVVMSKRYEDSDCSAYRELGADCETHLTSSDSCTWCRSRELVCAWDGIGTRCTNCKKSKRGCDRWAGGDSKPVEAGRTQNDLEKFAENLEKRLARMEKVVDRLDELF